jgi:fructoselysine 6-kinase
MKQTPVLTGGAIVERIVGNVTNPHASERSVAAKGSLVQRQGVRPPQDDAIGRALACVGDNCVDRYLAPISRRFAAGNAVNVAVGLFRAGFAVDYFGAVGDDAAGEQIVAALVGAGVGVDHVRRLSGPSSLTEIRLEAGERRFAGFSEGAAEQYLPSAVDLADLRDRPLVHAVNLMDCRALFSSLLAAGVPCSYDFDDARDLTLAEGLAVAFFSATADESVADAQQLAMAAVRHGAGLAVVMCGARGSVGCDHERTFRLEADPIMPVDTCGAGDSYIAAFLGAGLGGAGLERCMRAGGRAATVTCLSLSALPIDDHSPKKSSSKTSAQPGVREVR